MLNQQKQQNRAIRALMKGNKMNWTTLIVSSILTGTAVFLVWFFFKESIKMPRERTIKVIMRFGKFYTALMSWDGRRLNNPQRKYHRTLAEKITPAPEPWDIVPTEAEYKQSWSETWNIYFYPWPIFKTYEYPFSYLKLKKKGDLKPDDVVIWSNEVTSEVLVSRSGMTSYIDCQAEYPTITGDLYTLEMAKVLVFTNNTLQATNPHKMLFAINNWFGVTTETISAALKGVVGELSIQKLNQVRSESEEEGKEGSHFTQKMLWINEGKEGVKDGIHELWGVKLVKSVFRAFTPGDEQAKTLMNSYLKPKIALQEGEAAVTKATKEGEAKVATATADATAYSKNQEAIVIWKKKFLIDTGLAKVDATGNITELLPDANTRVGAEAVKELSKLTGTLVLGGDIQTMLGINTTQTKKGEEKP